MFYGTIGSDNKKDLIFWFVYLFIYLFTLPPPLHSQKRFVGFLVFKTCSEVGLLLVVHIQQYQRGGAGELKSQQNLCVCGGGLIMCSLNTRSAVWNSKS